MKKSKPARPARAMIISGEFWNRRWRAKNRSSFPSPVFCFTKFRAARTFSGKPERIGNPKAFEYENGINWLS